MKFYPGNNQFRKTLSELKAHLEKLKNTQEIAGLDPQKHADDLKKIQSALNNINTIITNIDRYEACDKNLNNYYDYCAGFNHKPFGNMSESISQKCLEDPSLDSHTNRQPKSIVITTLCQNHLNIQNELTDSINNFKESVKIEYRESLKLNDNDRTRSFFSELNSFSNILTHYENTLEGYINSIPDEDTRKKNAPDYNEDMIIAHTSNNEKVVEMLEFLNSTPESTDCLLRSYRNEKKKNMINTSIDNKIDDWKRNDAKYANETNLDGLKVDKNGYRPNLDFTIDPIIERLQNDQKDAQKEMDSIQMKIDAITKSIEIDKEKLDKFTISNAGKVKAKKRLIDNISSYHKEQDEFGEPTDPVKELKNHMSNIETDIMKNVDSYNALTTGSLEISLDTMNTAEKTFTTKEPKVTLGFKYSDIAGTFSDDAIKNVRNYKKSLENAAAQLESDYVKATEFLKNIAVFRPTLNMEKYTKDSMDYETSKMDYLDKKNNREAILKGSLYEKDFSTDKGNISKYCSLEDNKKALIKCFEAAKTLRKATDNTTEVMNKKIAEYKKALRKAFEDNKVPNYSSYLDFDEKTLDREYRSMQEKIDNPKVFNAIEKSYNEAGEAVDKYYEADEKFCKYYATLEGVIKSIDGKETEVQKSKENLKDAKDRDFQKKMIINATVDKLEKELTDFTNKGKYEEKRYKLNRLMDYCDDRISRLSYEKDIKETTASEKERLEGDIFSSTGKLEAANKSYKEVLDVYGTAGFNLKVTKQIKELNSDLVSFERDKVKYQKEMDIAYTNQKAVFNRNIDNTYLYGISQIEALQKDFANVKKAYIWDNKEFTLMKESVLNVKLDELYTDKEKTKPNREKLDEVFGNIHKFCKAYTDAKGSAHRGTDRGQSRYDFARNADMTVIALQGMINNEKDNLNFVENLIKENNISKEKMDRSELFKPDNHLQEKIGTEKKEEKLLTKS